MKIINDAELAKAIHYPGCWDTTAYPTLRTALWEFASCEFKCSTCSEKTNNPLDDLQAHFERVNLETAKLVRKLDAHDDLVKALQEIVRNDPYNQSSAGIIARAALFRSGVA